MKPIFSDEKKFFEKYLNVQLPDNCWREDNSIYLNVDPNTLLVSYEFKLGNVNVLKNQIAEITNNYPNLSWDLEIQNKLNHLQSLESESISKTIEFIKNHNLNQLEQLSFFENETSNSDPYTIPYRVSFSGGKDSTVTLNICLQAFKELGIENYAIDYLCTGSDTADTTRVVKSLPKDKLVITKPKIGFYPFFKKQKNYYIPSVTKRLCCDNFKESAINKVLNPKRDYILFLGVRNTEGSKRAYLGYDVNKSFLEKEALKKEKALKSNTLFKPKKLNVPTNWNRFAPIVNWSETDVWLYILWKNLNFSDMYKKGYTRVGCLHCPFQKDIVDILNKEFYPHQTSVWNSLLYHNYVEKRVEQRLKWSLDEWIAGRWKQGTSKETELTKKYTPENVKLLAEFKGIEPHLAEKYFIKKCCNCNKKVNPTDTAMTLKFYGRKSSDILCKKCFKDRMQINEEDYKELLYTAREGCSLF